MGTETINQQKQSAMIDFVSDPEDVGDIFIRNVGRFVRNTLHYNPEDRILHDHHCEEFRSTLYSFNVE
jgi:hypothetical protein